MTKQRVHLLNSALAVSAAFALASCGSPTDTGAEAGSLRVVSLNPCLDAILVDVAAPAQIAALSHYSRDPAAGSMDVERAEQFAFTGGTAEEVLALRPDLVLASSFIDPPTKSALERSGLTVETFGSPASVEESFAQIREVASLVGREDAGEALILSIESAPARPQAGSVAALLWQPGQIVAGETSLVAEHLEWAGFANHAAERGLGQADYVSLEGVLADPPPLLLIAGDAPGQSHPLLSESRDAMHIARFEPRLFYCGGPSIKAARERLLEIRAEVEGDI